MNNRIGWYLIGFKSPAVTRMSCCILPSCLRDDDDRNQLATRAENCLISAKTRVEPVIRAALPTTGPLLAWGEPNNRPCVGESAVRMLYQPRHGPFPKFRISRAATGSPRRQMGSIPCWNRCCKDV